MLRFDQQESFPEKAGEDLLVNNRKSAPGAGFSGKINSRFWVWKLLEIG
jgi:hypothetical protein